MRQCGEDHGLFTASEVLPVNLRFEPTVNNTEQIRMRGGKGLSTQVARCSTKAAHLGMTREPVEQLTAAIARCAQDNRVNSHAVFRDAAEFCSAPSRQTVLGSCLRCTRAARAIR